MQAPPPPGSHYTCRIRLNTPYKATFKAQGSNRAQPAIIAFSEAYCDHTPVAHVVHLKLTHYVDHGGWQPLPNFYGMGSQDCGEIPPPTSAGKPATCIIAVPCVVPSRYRAEALVTGTAVNEDGEQVSYSVVVDPPSPEIEIACH